MLYEVTSRVVTLDPLNAELNLTCHLLALFGAHHILHVSRIRVKFTYAPLQVANFIINTVLFKLINFTFCSQIISNHPSHCSDYPYRFGVDTATIAI